MTATFKGWLPSIAPYVRWTFRGLDWDPHKHELTMKHARQCVEGSYAFCIHENGGQETLNWMLSVEIPESPVSFGKEEDKIRKVALERCMTFLKTLGTTTTQGLPLTVVLETSAFVLREFCDYYRLPDVIKLLTLCVKHYPAHKQHAIKQRIARMPTDEMRRIVDANPLELFFNAGKQFTMHLPTYGALVENKRDTYKPFEMCAARVLDFFRRVYIAEQKHTGCLFDTLKEVFLRHEPGAKYVFDQAFWTLVKAGALTYNRELSYVTLPQLQAHADNVTHFIRRLLSYGQDHAPLRRSANDGAPGVPPMLTDEQTRAAWHMLNNPLTIVVGPPGRGKTSMVVWAVAAFQNSAVVSFVGTNVASHRERMGGRSEVSNTAHHFYYTCQNVDKSWGEVIESFVWDEFSNVPLSLASRTLLCVPNARRALFVLDPAQIAPLKPGHVGVDFIGAFPQHTHTLTVNLRVSSNARALAEAAVHILRGEHRERIDWSDDLNDLASITYIDARHSFQRHIQDLLQHLYAYVGVYQVYSLKDIQFIAFTREMRDMANEVIEKCLAKFPNWAGCRNTSGAQVHGLFLYIGCKICIRGESFPSFRDGHYHAIRNGEMGIIQDIYVSPGLGTTIRLDVGHRVKTLLLNKNLHVNPAHVHLAHCITADVSQGSEYKTVVGLFHDGCAQDDWIGRSRVYVMASRAQQAFIAFGKRVLDAFNTIASRVDRTRSSCLLPMLLNMAQGPTEEREVPSLDDMKRATDLSNMPTYTGIIPCVPVPSGSLLRKL